MGIIQLIFLFVNLFSISVLSANLEEVVKQKMDSLEVLIKRGDSIGVETQKEKLAYRTAEIFLEYARWDEAHIADNINYFSQVSIYKDKATEYGTQLPDFERKELIALLDSSISHITKVINKEIYQKQIPIIDWGNIEIKGDHLELNGKPIFITDFFWKPEVPKLCEYFGDINNCYISPSFLQDKNGTIGRGKQSQLEKEANKNNIGFVFLDNRNIPDWAKSEYGSDFYYNVRYAFVSYDIDNPGAEEMMDLLFSKVCPIIGGKKCTQLGYMIANEPHFFTQKGGWCVVPISQHSIKKFRKWLKEKHKSINELNELWSTNFTNFDSVQISLPIDSNLRGQPIWYDWCRFNNDRVTDWYKKLKSIIRKYDANAKIHLKYWPSLWIKNWRDHGMDFEAITRLSDILGNDAGIEHSNMREANPYWAEKYSMEWQEMAMTYDFLKSVSPNKFIFNTESHYISTAKSRNLYLSQQYVNEAVWLNHIMGLTVDNVWYWARNEDGSARNNTYAGDQSYPGTVVHQPRVAYQVISTLYDLNSYSEYILSFHRQKRPLRIYYTETSAINMNNYMDKIREIYEELFFEGISLGFATDLIIRESKVGDFKVIVVYNTPYVTAKELEGLQKFIDNGGTVIVDNVSLKKDEYNRALNSLKSTKGTVIYVSDIVSMKNKAFKVIKSALPEVKIKELDGSYKTIHWRELKEGKDYIISMENLGKESKKVTFTNLPREYKIIDLLTQKKLNDTLLIPKFGVVFCKIVNKDSTTGVFEGESILEKNIEIYPNPIKEKVILEGIKIEQIKYIKVFNSRGELQKVEITSTDDNVQISFKQVKSKGLYIVVIKTHQDKTYRFKLYKSL